MSLACLMTCCALANWTADSFLFEVPPDKLFPLLSVAFNTEKVPDVSEACTCQDWLETLTKGSWQSHAWCVCSVQCYATCATSQYLLEGKCANRLAYTCKQQISGYPKDMYSCMHYHLQDDSCTTNMPMQVMSEEPHGYCGGVEGLLRALQFRHCCDVAVSLCCKAYYTRW